MLACIACSKQLDDGGDDSTARATTPGTKEPVKSLTSQIKDMVLKISGGNRQCKGGSTSSSYRSKSVHHRGNRPRYVDGSTSDGGQCTYLRSASSSRSMPAWDFTSSNHNSDSERRQRRQWIPGGGGGVGFPPEDDENEDEEDVVLEDNGEPKEWMAQVEPGVHITFVSLPGGAGNDLKRIRFSREMFNKWQAQRWWGENYDRIMELYNVQRFSSQALPTPPRSEDGEGHIGLQRNSSYPRVGSARDSPITQVQTQPQHLRSKERLFPNTGSSSSSKHKTLLSSSPSPRGGGTRSVPDPSESMLQHYFHPAAVAAFGGGGGGSNWVGGLSGMVKGEASSVEASRTTTSSRDEAASVSISNASDLEVTEWVEQDEPGVYITIRELPDGTRELRRVRFSREKFGEVRAKLWWEENRERIQTQYL